MTHLSGERQDRIAGPLPDAADARRGIAFEDGAVLGIGDLLRGVLRRLPVGVLGAPLHVIDLLAIKLEWNPQLDQCLHLTLLREDTFTRRRDRLEVAGADRGKADAAGGMDVDHAPAGEVALEGSGRL